jgi:hypothetical protein
MCNIAPVSLGEIAMRRFQHNQSPRTIVVRFAGKCACCGAPIAAGETATYYPSRKQIGHVGGLEGNSPRCTAEIRKGLDRGFVGTYLDIDRLYEDQCADICGR